MLLSTGERVSCALCAMAINDLGHRAISLTGSQAGIVTDTSHTKARILDVRADRIFAALDEDAIVLVAGFQGVSTARDVTTLGPRRLGHHRRRPGRRRRRRGVRDLHRRPGRLLGRSADRAQRAQAADRLLRGDARDGRLGRRRAAAALASSTPATTACASTADRASTTRPVPLSCPKRRPWSSPSSPPSPTRSARPASRSWACPDTPGIAGRVTTALAEANVNIDMIIQGEPETEGQRADMSFTIPRDDIHAAQHGAATRSPPSSG